MLLYDSFTIALRYSVKLPFSQFARVIISGLEFHNLKCMDIDLEVKKWIESWIDSTNASLIRDGIRDLPERWKKVVASDGQYFEYCYFEYYFLKIKPQILEKNSESKVVHLIHSAPIRFRDSNHIYVP